MIKKISIIGGGGTVGSATAFCLGWKSICEEVVLFDKAYKLALHHMSDIGCSICKSSKTRIAATENAADIASSDIVIVAASFPTGEGGAFSASDELVSALAEIAGVLRDYAQDSVVFTLSNPVDVINTMLWKLSGLRAKQFVGFSLNDSIRLDMAIAEYAGCDPQDVTSYCIGEHGFSKVPVLNCVSIRGVKRSFSDDEAERIQKIAFDHWMEFLRLGINRTAGWSTGVYVEACLEALAEAKDEALECSVILDGEYGYKGLSFGTPVHLCLKGVSKVIELNLNEREKGLLHNSYELVQSRVDELVSRAKEANLL